MSPAEIQATLGFLDAHKPAIAIGGICAMAGGFIQFAEALRLGYRHKTHAIPFYVLLFYLANDFTYVSLYDRWFHVLHHPLVMQSWYWYLVYPIVEFAVICQAMIYSREEIFPGLSKVQAWVAYAAAQAGMIAFFYWIINAADDYFLSITGMLTIVGSNMNIYLLTRRRSRKGQSMLYAWNIVFCAGPINWFVLFPAMTPRVNVPVHYALGAAMTVLNLVYVYALWRAPKYVAPDAMGDAQRAPGKAAAVA